MHNEQQEEQLDNVVIPSKIYGHESNPAYHMSPERLHSAVLEQRVFKKSKSTGKKRPKSSNMRSNGRLDSSAQNYKHTKYSNPGDRPQLKS